MTQPELKGAVERLTEARQAATDHGMRSVIMSTTDCDVILQALQRQQDMPGREDVHDALLTSLFLPIDIISNKMDQRLFSAADAILALWNKP